MLSDKVDYVRGEDADGLGRTGNNRYVMASRMPQAAPSQAPGKGIRIEWSLPRFFLLYR